mmetsp:Transcript_3940/g.4547  ORF Transcript_3940/g.4547 Transcript_3940/m.4547 type:complete len:95 (+) Transcript_3940:146-430(+)|eukprot:CAMPEP_0194145428 /NCGR_PEP_ID=MMETSP0152-20130528/17427_1 /TAXON_ID=1049557 /ORGANISM="Thalassiothrix antarctica, Strain L6-D1" /LENGTH=94 /DNA_ID=CAMNT_0038845667 /DNA_START=126 /DNA_END=410 /DNA_ORIENTATION=-
MGKKWFEFEGHEVAVLGSVSGFYAIANKALGPGWIKSLIHRQPHAALCILGLGVGLLMPLTVVPLRRALKFPTNQYDAAHKEGVVYPKYATALN